MNKLPGKTEYSGRRRNMTRKSGFKVSPGSTGGEYKVLQVGLYLLPERTVMNLKFTIPACSPGKLVGFGGWFCAPDSAQLEIVSGDRIPSSVLLTSPSFPDWSKLGSIWESDGKEYAILVQISSDVKISVGFWGMACGVIEHRHLTSARDVLLVNMYEFAPEANFYVIPGNFELFINGSDNLEMDKSPIPLFLKSCNRCARFLPINVPNERNHLSFTNHCVAEHRRPCSHTGFGKLRNVETGEVLKLEFGFQLECRFCKKFEVNAAHNPQRTASQMKEDAARRRAFELLLMELYGGSSQLLYRHQTGRELADDVWKKYDRHCFNCGLPLGTAKAMHLDHTRPLALLWPLDSTATALCENCNSLKRDRPPREFYDAAKLQQLAKISGLDIAELEDPSPNVEAVDLIVKNLEWFFDDFLSRPELTKVRDGKTAGELLVKALQKVINKVPGGSPI